MSEKIIITFPDGNKKEVDKGINGLELASQISKSPVSYTHLTLPTSTHV